MKAVFSNIKQIKRIIFNSINQGLYQLVKAIHSQNIFVFTIFELSIQHFGNDYLIVIMLLITKFFYKSAYTLLWFELAVIFAADAVRQYRIQACGAQIDFACSYGRS